MKTLIKTAVLKEALRTVQVLTAKSVISAPTGTDCLITATDTGATLEMGMQGVYAKIDLDAQTEEPGEVCINSSYLAGLRLSSAVTLIKFTTGRHVFLKCGGLTVQELAVSQNMDRVKSQRPAEVPTTINIPTKLLVEGVKLIAFQPTATNQNLSVKLLVDPDKDKFCTYTSDFSYRGALYKRSFDCEKAFDVVLPLQFISAVVSRLSTKEASMGTDGKTFRITTDSIDIYHPLKQVKFPDLDAFVDGLDSKKASLIMDFDTAGAASSIGEVSSIVTGALGLDVKLEMTADDSGEVGIQVKSSIGKTNSTFKANITKGKVGNLKLSAKYLLDFLNLASKGRATLESWDKLLIVKGNSHEYLTYVMPTIVN